MFDSIGAQLAASIIATRDNQQTGPVNPANWPDSAGYAVEYYYHDKQFPNVDQSVVVMYFDDLSEVTLWRRQKAEFCKDTDGDFSLSVTHWQWNWGPEIKATEIIDQYS